MIDHDYNYFVWAIREKKKDALRNHVVSKLCELETLINKFSSKDFKQYNKVKKIVDDALSKLAKLGTD